MSANYTENYNLCQWEPSDPVLRTDFNEDNAKLDAALASIAGVAGAAKAQAQAITDAAYTKTDYPPLTGGTYVGNGKNSQAITLGFRPRVVIVFSEMMELGAEGNYIKIAGGVALNGISLPYNPVAITANGFQVFNQEISGNMAIRVNYTSTTYIYLAFR